MKKIIEYNIDNFNLETDDLKSIYSKERNACFASVYYDELNNIYYALTDHLGNVPVFYSFDDNKNPIFSLNPLDFRKKNISKETVKRFLATGSLRFLKEENVFSIPYGSILEFKKEKDEWIISNFYKYDWNFNKKFVLNELDFLLNQATIRLINSIKNKEVSLALSGGIDSAITAYYLKKNNVKVNAFTVSPWGEDDVEALKAKKTFRNLKLDSHSIFSLNTNDYDKYLKEYKKVYPYPNGSVASLTISTLWNHTKIADSGVVFFAQNADTMFCSVIHQFSTYFYMKAPKFIRYFFTFKYFNYNFNLLENYLSFIVLGNKNWWTDDLDNFIPKTHKIIQKLTFAGMLWGHTPSDGEVFVAPAVYKNISIKNIFYDVDLIESILSLPIIYRLSFSKESKIKIAITKRILLNLAKKIGVADDYQKKGLVLPKNKDSKSKNFFNNMISNIDGVELKGENHLFALKMIEEYGLNFNK